MTRMYETLTNCVERIRKRTDFQPEVAVVLGSGLGDYARNVEVECEIPYGEIDGFPVSTVPGHDGRFIFGRVKGVPVVLMKGRVHYYEGYGMGQVVMPIRIMGMLGAKTLLLTNAAGGINLDFDGGTLMMITDHISLAVPNPLLGENISELGERFPDMSNVYDKELCERIRQAAEKEGIALKEGVYMQCTGPSYETPAEIRMMRTLGVDAVGMSTVCEATAAVHMGMKVCGISCITNMAAGIQGKPLSHAEVQETADRVKDTFEKLVTGFLASFAENKA